MIWEDILLDDNRGRRRLGWWFGSRLGSRGRGRIGRAPNTPVRDPEIEIDAGTSEAWHQTTLPLLLAVSPFRVVVVVVVVGPLQAEMVWMALINLG